MVITARFGVRSIRIREMPAFLRRLADVVADRQVFLELAGERLLVVPVRIPRADDRRAATRSDCTFCPNRPPYFVSAVVFVALAPAFRRAAFDGCGLRGLPRAPPSPASARARLRACPPRSSRGSTALRSGTPVPSGPGRIRFMRHPAVHERPLHDHVVRIQPAPLVLVLEVRDRRAEHLLRDLRRRASARSGGS